MEVGSLSEVEHTLDEMVSKAAIRDCIARCCRGVDRLDKELILSAYHPDAIDDHGLFVGNPVEFADWVIPFFSDQQACTSHQMTNHLCDLNGDVAHCETYYLFLGRSTDGSEVISFGRYVDRFERRGGIWKIARRVCFIEGGCNVPANAALPLPSTYLENPAWTPSRDRNDPSYQRPLAP